MVKQKVIKLLDGRNTLLQIVGPRALRLAPLSPGEEVINEEGKLIGVNYGDNEIVVGIGETIKIDKDVYKVSDMIRSNDPESSGYQLVIHTLTRSSNLIMPFLGNSRQFFRWGKNFCNCFIGTEEHGDYGSSIYLLYRWDGTKKFVEFEEEIQSHPWFAGSYEPDKHHSMYEFCIPDGNTDITAVLKGQYSQISSEGKEQILNFHGHGKDHRMAKIFRRDPILREQMIRELSIKTRVEIPEDAELLSKFVIDDEMYLDKFRIKDGRTTDTEDKEEVW